MWSDAEVNRTPVGALVSIWQWNTSESSALGGKKTLAFYCTKMNRVTLCVIGPLLAVSVA